MSRDPEKCTDQCKRKAGCQRRGASVRVTEVGSNLSVGSGQLEDGSSRPRPDSVPAAIPPKSGSPRQVTGHKKEK